MQGVSNQLLYNLVHLHLRRSLVGGLWVCPLDLCPQDTKRSFKLENNLLLISSLGRQQHFSSAPMLQGSGKPGVTLTVVWSSTQEPGKAVLHTPHYRGCWTVCELLT